TTYLQGIELVPVAKEFLNLIDKLGNPPSLPSVSGSHLKIKELEFKNVSFRYEKEGRWILSDINLKIQTGDRILIKGPSGVGKSTLVELLIGYRVPTKGEVMVNGKKLSDRVFLREFQEKMG